MKYKNKLKNLKARQNAWSQMSAQEQHSNRKPGSEKK